MEPVFRMWSKRRSGQKKLVQQTVIGDFRFVDCQTAINVEEGLHPFVAQIMADTPASKRQILMTVGKAEPAAVDKAREGAVARHKVWQAGIAVGDDNIFL